MALRRPAAGAAPSRPDPLHHLRLRLLGGWLADKEDSRRRADENGQTDTVCRCCDWLDELCYIDMTKSIGLFESKDGREARKEMEATTTAASHEMST